jgi:hypothetical protein
VARTFLEEWFAIWQEWLVILIVPQDSAAYPARPPSGSAMPVDNSGASGTVGGRAEVGPMAAAGTNNRQQAWLSVYQQVVQHHQAITDFRAKLLGLLPIASGAALIVVLKDGLSVERVGLALGLGLFACVLTIGLFFYELRGMGHCLDLEQSARELEKWLELPPNEATRPFNFMRLREPEMGGLIGARGSAWLIYPAVLGAWLYLSLFAAAGIWLANLALQYQVLATLIAAVVLVVGACRVLINALERKDVVPGAFGGNKTPEPVAADVEKAPQAA